MSSPQCRRTSEDGDAGTPPAGEYSVKFRLAYRKRVVLRLPSNDPTLRPASDPCVSV
jgi:hypothetical protein